MQAHQRQEPYTVLEYQSSDARVFGVEVRQRTLVTLRGLLGAVRWVGNSEGFRRDLTFLVMTLPMRTYSDQLQQIADCARASGVLDKLRLVVPPNAHRLAATLTSLQRLEIPALLGGVGRNSRFGDMTDHPINGIVIDPELVASASGDPYAASVLDAIVVLATNLGLKSFASDCATQSAFDLAMSAGVSYVSDTRPSIEISSFASPGVRRAAGGTRRWASSRDSRH